MKKWTALLLVAALLLGLLSGCSGLRSLDGSGEEDAGDTTVNMDPIEVEYEKTSDEMFTDRDRETQYSESEAVRIELGGDSALASSDGVVISGTTVTITEDKTHIISGTLNDGMIIVDAPDTAKLQLVFSGVDIYSSTSAALYIRQADKVFVTLAPGTENTLENGGTFTAIDENNIDAALFSKQDLTLNGSGSLTVISPAGHGIVGKDDLVIAGGTYTVTSASHGMDANDSVRIDSASIMVDAGKDGIHAENADDTALGFVYIAGGTITVEAEGDGISAGADLQILDGTINIVAGGGSVNGTKASSDNFGNFMGGGGMGGGMRPGQRTTSGSVTSTSTGTALTDDSSTSMKGLKAGTGISVSGGTITVDSADDAVHSNLSAVISGGVLDLKTGDDGIHAEETLAITAGQISISESYEGLEALHIDIRGGTIDLVSSDDGLNAAGGTDASGTTGGRDGMFGPGGGMSANSNGSITISGGTLYVNASGDGLDANGTLTISGGHTTVVGPTQGDTATLDYDTSATITGGTFIGTGASGMAQTFSGSTQGVIAGSVGNQAAGTQITLKDSDGNEIISYAPELSFAVVILSSPSLQKGGTYTISIGDFSAECNAS